MKRKDYIINFSILAVIFIFSYMLYYYGIVNMENVINSDNAYYAIAGKEVLNGNIILKGWYGATNTFYFLILVYGFLGKIIGYNISLIYIVSSVVWAAMVTFISYISASFSKNQIDKLIKLILAISVCYSSCYLNQAIKILGGVHLDAMLLSLVFIWVISNEKKFTQKCIFKYIFAFLCLVLAILSDELVVYFSVLPAFLVLFARSFIMRKKRKDDFGKLIFVIFTTVISKVLLKLVAYVGGIQLVWNASSIHFVESDCFFDRIEFFIEEFLYIFNADLFGNEVSLNSAPTLLRFVFLLMLLAGIVFSFGELKRTLLNQILFLMIFLQSCILLFTQYLSLTDGITYTSRIMYYLFVALTILFVQVDYKNGLEKVNLLLNDKIVHSIIALFAILVLFVDISEIHRTEPQRENNKYQKVAQILKDKGLTKGYGTHWLANMTTLASGCEIYVNPATNSNDFSKMKWLSFDTSRWDYANFVLIDDSNYHNVTRDTVVQSIGNPDEEIQVDNITIMVWDKNIMPYINESGADQQKDYWWNLSDDQKTKIIDVDNKHFFSAFEADENGSFVSDKEGQLIYGPSRNFDEGIYDITFVYTYESDTEEDSIGYVDVFSNSDKIDYKKEELLKQQNSITIEDVKVSDECTDAEFRAYAYYSGLSIEKIIYTKKIIMTG